MITENVNLSPFLPFVSIRFHKLFVTVYVNKWQRRKGGKQLSCQQIRDFRCFMAFWYFCGSSCESQIQNSDEKPSLLLVISDV